MDPLKQQIERKLVANVIVDKCAHNDQLIFRDAWCTQERVVRFTTPFFREYFSYVPSEAGKWGTGDCVMYEVNNDIDSFVVNCVLDSDMVDFSEEYKRNQLIKAANISDSPNGPIVLKSWELSKADNNSLFSEFDTLLNKSIPQFEQELQDKINTGNAEEILKEGDYERVVSQKYERNPKARAACLKAHGTACMVCGMDFGKQYGPEMEGKIEVHHIVPLSMIGKEYVVDPIHDLIPVCPNCHTALHSKKGGVYTVEELKSMRNKK